MAFIGQALGAGYTSDWNAADSTGNLLNPGVTSDMLQKANGNVQTGVDQQQAFMQALQGQNGIQNQNTAFQGFQGLAAGTGPNPAQAQLAQATQANVANQAAMAAGQRGASQNVGMIARGAANQGANIQQQSAGQAATMGAQQQMQGLQGMANISGQQVNNQAQATQGYNQAAQSSQQNLYGAQAGFNNAAAGMYNNQNTANQGIQLQNSKNQSGMFGGLLSGAGGILSDERQKTDIKPADDKIKDFLDKAGAHEYKYKDSSLPGASPGKHVSPMAQELEKSELGKQMVVETPNGKGVDYGRSMGTLLAALASVNKRLDQVESGGKKKMATGGKVEADKEFETFPGPQKLAEGGFLFSSAQRKPGGEQQPNAMQQAGQTSQSENPMYSGANQLGQAIGEKISPYVDKIKDYFHNESRVDLENMSDLDLENVQNPRGMESLDGSTVAPQDMGTTTSVDPFGAPLSQDAMPPEAPPSTGLESIGGEGATEVASADTAGEAAGAAEGASAAEGAAAATEAAGAYEGAGSAVALLASKGAMPKKKVPALVSPGEAYIPPHKVKSVASGKQSVRQAGEVIPGKAKVKGDSQKNDTVDKTLDAGGVVVPRSKMKSEDSAAKFVQAIMSKSGSRGLKR